MATKTWIGGGNNRASNPADWSSGTAPQPGDDLVMKQGVMNVSGIDLEGDRLSVSNAQINSQGFSILDLSTSGNVNVDVHGILVLTHLEERGTHLQISGDNIWFIGSNVFGGNGGSQGTSLLKGNLDGWGTLQLTGGNHNGNAMEVNGSVGRGLTFEVGNGGAPTESLRIDDPSRFHASLVLAPDIQPSGSSLFGFVAFMGLHATSADLHNEILSMFDGNKLVDTVRVSGGTGWQLQQNSQGVMLTAFGASQQPGGLGVVIPLHTS